jgi:YueH-like protein
MKIRKTTVEGNQANVYIYENKKEEYTVVAVPSIHWSILIPYVEGREEIMKKIKETISIKDVEVLDDLAEKIYFWVREM